MILPISVDPPLRQGQSIHNFLLCEFLPDQEVTQIVNATEEELSNEYADRSGKQILSGEVTAPMTELLVSFFSCFAKTKTVSHNAKTFKSTEDWPCVRCCLKANPGFLYPLHRSFFFIHKPPTFIRYSEIQYIQFILKKTSSTTNRNFNLLIKTNSKENQEILFINISHDEFKPLFEFCCTKDKIQIIDKETLTKRIRVENQKNSTDRTSKRLRQTGLAFQPMVDDEHDDEGDESDDDFDEREEEGQFARDQADDMNYDEDENLEEDADEDGSDDDEDDGVIDMRKRKQSLHDERPAKRRKHE